MPESCMSERWVPAVDHPLFSTASAGLDSATPGGQRFRCGVGALSRMGQVLGEKNDRNVFARACLSCWNDVRKAVAGIVAARLVPARCNDLRTMDLHPLAVRPTPVTVDHVRQ